MSFLKHNFDLKRTKFKDEDLNYARGYWQFLIENSSPEWLESPCGDLSIDWNSTTTPSAIRLIHLAKLFYAIANSIEKQCHPTFGEKLKEFLYSASIQHQEQITEFIVGGLITNLDRLIKLEPRSSTTHSKRNVDYSVQWDENTTVFIESTVLHIQRILDWQDAVEKLKNRFQKEIMQKSLNRALLITAPLELTNKTLSIESVRTALDFVAEKEEGKHTIRLDKENLLLEWFPAPHFEDIPISGLEKSSAFAFTMGKGVEIGAFAATNVKLKWPGNVENLVNKSLRNTLDAKRKQFQLSYPYLLMMRVLDPYTPIDGIIDLFTRRIFNNKKYKWLSAVGVLKITFDQKVGYKTKTNLIYNSNAINPLPDNIVESISK